VTREEEEISTEEIHSLRKNFSETRSHRRALSDVDASAGVSFLIKYRKNPVMGLERVTLLRSDSSS